MLISSAENKPFSYRASARLMPTPGNASAALWVDDNLIVLDGDQGVTSFDVSRCRRREAYQQPAIAVID